MDLGIQNKSAIVCGASRGLGKACAGALAREGVNVWLCARTQDTLEQAAQDITGRASGQVRTQVADLATVEGRAAIVAACPEPDILINNAGGPPTGNFRDWSQEQWFAALNTNMLSAIDMIRHCLDGMTGRGFGRIVNITSICVKLPQAELGLSNAARSGLTGFIAGIAREPARHNVTINNLLPGYTDTSRMRDVLQASAAALGQPVEEYNRSFFNRIPAGRPGNADEFAAVCAFLCSRQAGYITAQNILVDGGLYPGTF